MALCAFLIARLLESNDLLVFICHAHKRVLNLIRSAFTPQQLCVEWYHNAHLNFTLVSESINNI